MQADFQTKQIHVQVGVLGEGIDTSTSMDQVEGASIGEYRTFVTVQGHDLETLGRTPFYPDGFLFVVHPGENRNRLDALTATFPKGDPPPLVQIGPALDLSFQAVDSIQAGLEALMPKIWEKVQAYHDIQIANPPKAGPADPEIPRGQ